MRQVYHPGMEASRELQVPVEGSMVGATLLGGGGTLLALGHGAGGNRKNPALVSFARRVAETGRSVLLFNFPYSERKGRIPDPPKVLEGTVRSLARHAREVLGAERLVLGGRSMGGRICSQAVAQGLPAEALVFLSYPLHPPGRTDTLRTAHFPRIGIPMLFVQGTKDAFARWDLLTSSLAPLGAGARLFPVEGADHSLRVPKRGGGDQEETDRAVVGAVVGFLDGLGL
jgi:predicted alpha/beta-hydrolase family hydrolase